MSWGRAFLLAVKIVLVSLLWWILGAFLVFLGGVGIFGHAVGHFFGLPRISGLLGLVLIAIGWFISAFGTIATLVKYVSEAR